MKKIQVRSHDDTFLKISAKCTNFEVSSLGLGVFYEVSVSKVTVSTTSMVHTMVIFVETTMFKLLNRNFVLFTAAKLGLVKIHPGVHITKS